MGLLQRPTNPTTWSSNQQGDQLTFQCGPAGGEIDDLGRKIEGIILELAE